MQEDQSALDTHAAIAAYQSGTVNVAGLKTNYLSPSDMVLPLMCGICMHLIYIGLLIPITVLFYNDYQDLDACINVNFDVLLSLLLTIHTLILIIECIATCSSLTAKASGTNRFLNTVLTIRVVLNALEVLLVFYGFYTVFIDKNNSRCWRDPNTDIVYILIVLFLVFNLSIVLFTWCCLFCCLSSSSPTRKKKPKSDNCLHRCLNAMVYGSEASKVTTSFYGQGGLIDILSHGTKYSPSEIITGLHLLRMLQKHYGIIDKNYNTNPTLYKPLKNNELIEECIYYTLYSNAAYGIALYSMTSPCFICCAPPCCLPSHFDDKYSDNTIPQTDKIVLRKNKCCYPVQIDNSSFKTFIQRTHCTKVHKSTMTNPQNTNTTDPQNNILLVSQIGGLHKVNFYVVIDHEKECLVIAIRGTLSLGDSITDANTEPELSTAIKTSYINGIKTDNKTDIDCYIHKGIGKCATDTFDTIMESKKVLEFITDDKYKHYGLVICGHSLGAGTTVLLSIMMKYGTNENLKHFINNDRKTFKAYAIAPPAVIDKNFAFKKQNEISKFLTCVIYNHDMIPRLSFRNLITTRAAISLLLNELNKTKHGPWYVYKQAMTTHKNTILEILNDSDYCNNNKLNNVVIDSEEEEYKHNDEAERLLPRSSGESRFMNDVEKEAELLRDFYDKHLYKDWHETNENENNDYKKSDLYKNNQLLWDTKFCQVGEIVFVAKDNDDDDDGDENGNKCMECVGNMCSFIGRSVISNVCRCRCCLDPSAVKYKAYIANIDLFCDKMIFSKSMLPDHMPHVYLDVLERVNK